MKIAIIALAALALAGCNTTPPEVQERLISVPSSAPYRYITFSQNDDPDTIRQIKRHNRSHSAVIAAERKAKAEK